MKFTHTPFNQNLLEKESFVKAQLEEMGLKLPPEGKRHFVSHLDELNLEALKAGFRCWRKYCSPGGYDGVHTWRPVELEGLNMVTRLTGPRMGDESLELEPRSLKDRGEGRGFQSCVVRDTPFTACANLTFICFHGVLWTLHSGPEMPPMESDPEGEWNHNALAFRPDELS